MVQKRMGIYIAASWMDVKPSKHNTTIQHQKINNIRETKQKKFCLFFCVFVDGFSKKTCTFVAAILQ